MGPLKLFTKSLNPTKLYLLSSSTTKSSLQIWFENVLGKTRQFVRVFTRKRNEIASDSFRSQYRLPVEYLSKPTVPSKTKYLNYRPGFIHELTSKWVSESIAGTVGKQATRKILRGAGGPMLGFVGFSLAKKPSLLTNEEELEGVSYEIREAFSEIPWQSYTEQKSLVEILSDKQISLSDLKIGDLIAKGCNAAVYSASLADTYNSESTDLVKENGILKQDDDDITQSKLFISHSEGEQNYENKISTESASTPIVPQQTNLNESNLAVKVMFNYNAESNAYAIWRAMYKETLPAVAEFSLTEMNWHKVRKKKLKPHPNIVEMYFAFADQLPLLPGAFTSYPQALPVRLLNDGCGRNMTLFLVMKRYHCNLKEFLETYDVSARTALLIFTQLLEALVHLLQNEIAHRDLKTDNILLDLTYGISSPRLAITDFGCSLESLQLNYQSPEVEKGGNIALMAPEVVTAEAGKFSVIDYSRADLWTVGALAYEIFGGSNPFYSPHSVLKNFKYDEQNLPPLSSKAPGVVQKLVKDILHLNPNQRPSQRFAATVCQILLHGPPDISQCSSTKDVSQIVLDWMFLMAAETYLEASLQNSESRTLEVELRHTFCSRIQYLEVLEAVKYIAQA